MQVKKPLTVWDRLSPFGIWIDAVYFIVILYILVFRTSDVFSNLEASFIWAYPVAASQLSIHRKLNQSNNTENTNGN